MLTLNDGRSELWQWDTGRKLTVDADCSQVHFSNKVFGRSIDVDVVDGVAIIPDILLQVDKELTAWAFVGTPENGYTKISKAFKVNKRNKPSDYVFTPTDQTALEEILDRLHELENTTGGSIDKEQIKNAVDEYLEANPPAQGAPGKDGVSATHLWNGTVLTVTSASGTSSADLKGDPGKDGLDGHTPVKGVDYFTDEERDDIVSEAATLVGGSGGGQSVEWKKLREFTIPDDPSADTSGITWISNDAGGITGFEFDTDHEGNSFECSELSIATQGSCSDNGTISFYGDDVLLTKRNSYQNSGERAGWGELQKRNGVWRWVGAWANTLRYIHDIAAISTTGFIGAPANTNDKIKKLGITGEVSFNSGYRFSIYGR